MKNLLWILLILPLFANAQEVLLSELEAQPDSQKVLLSSRAIDGEYIFEAVNVDSLVNQHRDGNGIFDGSGELSANTNINTGGFDISFQDTGRIIIEGKLLPTNLITNGNFDAGLTGWQNTTNWIIQSGGVNNSDGQTTVRDRLIQSIPLEDGALYKLTLSCTSYTSGAIRGRVGGVYSIPIDAEGEYEDYITAEKDNLFEIQEDWWFDGVIDNIVLQKIDKSKLESFGDVEAKGWLRTYTGIHIPEGRGIRIGDWDALSWGVGTWNTFPSINVAIGSNTLKDGAGVAIGVGALANQEEEGYSTAVGTFAGFSCTTCHGTFLGTGAGRLTTTAHNVTLGDESGAEATDNEIDAVGYYALHSLKTPWQGTGIGHEIFRYAETQYQTGIGFRTGYNLNGGEASFFAGHRAGYYMTTGTRNILIGTFAGGIYGTPATALVEDNDVILIGNSTIKASGVDVSNSIGIGSNVELDKGYQFKVGGLVAGVELITESSLPGKFKLRSYTGTNFIDNSPTHLTGFNALDELVKVDISSIPGDDLGSHQATTILNMNSNMLDGVRYVRGAEDSEMVIGSDGSGLYLGTGLGVNPSKPIYLGGTNGSINFLSGKAAILANGNFGIGTSSPSTTLQVNGSIKMVDGNEATDYVMTSDANGVGSWQPALGGLDGYIGNGGTHISGGPLDMGTYSFGNAGSIGFVDVPANRNKYFPTNGASVMIAQDGIPQGDITNPNISRTGTNTYVTNITDNFGVGTIAPAYSLHFQKNINGGEGIFARNSNAGSLAKTFFILENNLGSQASITAHSSTHAAWANITLFNSSLAGGTAFYQSGDAPFDYWTNGSKRMTLNGSGDLQVDGTTFNVDAINNRVGFGVTVPTAKLHVNGGTIKIDGTGAAIDYNATSTSFDVLQEYIDFSTSNGSNNGAFNVSPFEFNLTSGTAADRHGLSGAGGISTTLGGTVNSGEYIEASTVDTIAAYSDTEAAKNHTFYFTDGSADKHFYSWKVLIPGHWFTIINHTDDDFIFYDDDTLGTITAGRYHLVSSTLTIPPNGSVTWQYSDRVNDGNGGFVAIAIVN